VIKDSQICKSESHDQFRLLRQIETCPSDPTDHATLIYEGSSDNISDDGLGILLSSLGQGQQPGSFLRKQRRRTWIDRVHLDRFQSP
jgi:hypothetical protein